MRPFHRLEALIPWTEKVALISWGTSNDQAEIVHGWGGDGTGPALESPDQWFGFMNGGVRKSCKSEVKYKTLSSAEKKGVKAGRLTVTQRLQEAEWDFRPEDQAQELNTVVGTLSITGSGDFGQICKYQRRSPR